MCKNEKPKKLGAIPCLEEHEEKKGNENTSKNKRNNYRNPKGSAWTWSETSTIHITNKGYRPRRKARRAMEIFDLPEDLSQEQC